MPRIKKYTRDQSCDFFLSLLEPKKHIASKHEFEKNAILIWRTNFEGTFRVLFMTNSWYHFKNDDMDGTEVASDATDYFTTENEAMVQTAKFVKVCTLITYHEFNISSSNNMC